MAPPVPRVEEAPQDETEEQRIARLARADELAAPAPVNGVDQVAAGARPKVLNIKSRCPTFSEDCHYPTFKTMCKAYVALHDIPENKIGLVLAMNALPDSGSNNIKQRFFDENNIETLNTGEGQKMFWDFLDQLYEKDPIMEMCNKMKELFYYKRETGTNIKDYISEFEARVQRAIAKKVPKFPDELLMWLLLEGSNISESKK